MVVSLSVGTICTHKTVSCLNHKSVAKSATVVCSLASLKCVCVCVFLIWSSFTLICHFLRNSSFQVWTMLDMPGYKEYMWPDCQDQYTDVEVIVFLELFSNDWIHQNHY